MIVLNSQMSVDSTTGFGSDSSCSISDEDDFFRIKGKRHLPKLNVTANSFSENNKLLEGLSEEVKRLRDENKGISMTVESLTEENILLSDNLKTFGEKISQFQIKFHEFHCINKTLLEERNNYKMQTDSLSLKLAESESSLKVLREQYQEQVNKINAEMVLREISARQDHKHFHKQIAALQQYVSRLENECHVQYNSRVTEITIARQAIDRSSNLTKELDITRRLLGIEEEKTNSLQIKSSDALIEASKQNKYNRALLKSLGYYEKIFPQKQH